MNQCNQHFGDSTAYATVEWFLTQLTLTPLDSIFTEDFDNFCKDLNVVRFIDCLREQINEDEYLFTRIEGIARKLDEGNKFQKFPNFSVLLLSIAQKSLLDPSVDVEKTRLYHIGKKLYDHFKNNPNSHHDSCDVALKAGFQLSKLQDTLEWKREFAAFKEQHYEWKREFAAFKEQHYERLTYLRRQYFSADNPATFSNRVVERYKLIYGTSGSKNSDSEFIKLTQGFKNLNPESNFLHPLCLQLPILARSTKSINFADDFAKNLRDGGSDKEFSKSLAEEFRILQWNILVRDLVEEDRSGTSYFYPITDKLNIQGTQNREEILIKFFKEVRLAEYHFRPAEGEIPTEQRDDVSSITLPTLEKEMEECYASFQTLLPKVRSLHPPVHKDLVDSFAKMRKEGNTSNAVLIEDGELSFFSILWLLRYAAGKGDQPTDWASDPDKPLSVCFRPSKDKKNRDEWWTLHNMYKFAEECGLIILLPDTDNPEKCILTRRWRSLITWLKRLNGELNKSEDGQLPIVKNLDYGEAEQLFIQDLAEFLTSPNLKEFLDQVDVFSHVSMTCKDFAEKEFGPLMESLGSLLNVEFAGLNDTILFRCCRAGFIPLEHLFRAYWPCELHLLIQALNWEELRNSYPAPISLGFATIAGKVETDRKSKRDSENLQKVTTDFDHWLVPYRTLFSALGANIALPAVQEASEQIGIEEQKSDFAHQTSNLLDSVWNDQNLKELHFRSKFALWIARIHVSEMWGYHPIDTEEILNEKNVPYWEGDFINKPIVDVLIDLGIWGGITRANKTPKGGRRDNPEAAKLTRYARANLSSGDPQDLISKVRKLLAFEQPGPHNNPPPDWIHTRAFAICFYHGMWQAVYHALWTFVVSDEGKPKREWYLSIRWGDNSVSIYNRGEVKHGEVEKKHGPQDRLFFEIFMQKTDEFCRQQNINEKFVIDGPEPIHSSDTWRLVIRKEKSDEF